MYNTKEIIDGILGDLIFSGVSNQAFGVGESSGYRRVITGTVARVIADDLSFTAEIQ